MKRPTAKDKQQPQQPQPPVSRPVDVVDGIPDRAASRPLWKVLLPAVIFLGWLAFLIYCLLAC